MSTRFRIPAMLALAGLGLLLLSPGTTAAEVPPAVEQTCSNCHGNDGLSDDGDIPIIAGASAFYIENQLLIYREEARPCAAGEFEEVQEVDAENHCALAATLSEDQVADIGAYYSGQPFQPADQPVDQALADKGGSIHSRSCDKCHADGGSLDLDDAGILAGQWKPYLIAQMKHFQAGERWQPEKMQPEMKDLGEDDIKALAEYYASQGAERF